jgi:hypothetical protein
MHRAATRAWHLQWAKVAVVALVLATALAVELRPGVATVHPSGAFNVWSALGLILILYLAEDTWFEWRQLHEIRNLAAPPTVAQFREARSRERLHKAVAICLLVACCTGLLLWVLWGFKSIHYSTQLCLGMPVAGAIAAAFRAWRDLRRAAP